jgi:hypothetical protein
MQLLGWNLSVRWATIGWLNPLAGEVGQIGLFVALQRHAEGFKLSYRLAPLAVRDLYFSLDQPWRHQSGLLLPASVCGIRVVAA